MARCYRIPNSQLFKHCVIGASVGWFAWGRNVDAFNLMWLLLLPLAWGQAKSRWSASALIAAYYLSSTRDLPSAVAIFFGEDAPIWAGATLWIVACALLALPFVLLWSSNAQTRALRFAVAVCVTILPPIGLIGWVSPISFAGSVFPGLGWFGFGLAFLLTMFLVSPSKKWLAGLGTVAIIANIIAISEHIDSPSNWLGVDTQFSAQLSAEHNNGMQRLLAMERIEWIKGFAKTVPANSVRVLPETLLGSFGSMAQLSLRETEADLVKIDSRILVGAELDNANGQYTNAMIVLGAKKTDDRNLAQGIPVPVSMWKPWANDGAIADIWGHRGTMEIDNVRAGVLICYEQFLAFSILQTMLNKPSVLVGSANVWWAHDSTFPLVQAQTMKVFSRLFGVNTILARNLEVNFNGVWQ